MYAWYNVLVSPSTFAGLEDITKGDDDGGGEISESFGDLYF